MFKVVFDLYSDLITENYKKIKLPFYFAKGVFFDHRLHGVCVNSYYDITQRQYILSIDLGLKYKLVLLGKSFWFFFDLDKKRRSFANNNYLMLNSSYKINNTHFLLNKYHNNFYNCFFTLNKNKEKKETIYNNFYALLLYRKTLNRKLKSDYFSVDRSLSNFNFSGLWPLNVKNIPYSSTMWVNTFDDASSFILNSYLDTDRLLFNNKFFRYLKMVTKKLCYWSMILQNFWAKLKIIKKNNFKLHINWTKIKFYLNSRLFSNYLLFFKNNIFFFFKSSLMFFILAFYFMCPLLFFLFSIKNKTDLILYKKPCYVKNSNIPYFVNSSLLRSRFLLSAHPYLYKFKRWIVSGGGLLKFLYSNIYKNKVDFKTGFGLMLSNSINIKKLNNFKYNHFNSFSNGIKSLSNWLLRWNLVGGNKLFIYSPFNLSLFFNNFYKATLYNLLNYKSKINFISLKRLQYKYNKNLKKKQLFVKLFLFIIFINNIKANLKIFNKIFEFVLNDYNLFFILLLLKYKILNK